VVRLTYMNLEIQFYVYKNILKLFTDASPSSGTQPTFLKVGSWVYPLVPGQSPVLKSHLGKYMFPDLDDSIEGNC
jgi:hypothetical protein